jgi:general secretion pathway protein M
MDRLLQLRNDLLAWLGKLSPRERVMVSVAAVAVVVFTASIVSVRISSSVSAREQRIEEKTRVLSQIGKLAEGYRAHQAERQAMESRLKGPKLDLNTYISQEGAKLQIEVPDLRHVNAPGETEGLTEDAVEVNLAKVDLGKLVRFLQALERGQGVVQVRRMRVTTRTDDKNLVDATFTVSAYQPKG